MPIVKADGLSKCFRIYRTPAGRLKEVATFGRRTYHDAFWAVQDVSLTLERGTCLGIIGANGSGKSTLLRMLAGVTRPTRGTLRVAGRVASLLELGVGFSPAFTGRENVFLSASVMGLTDAQTRERLPAIEKFAEIGEFLDRPVRMYSSGMFVRLAFALAVHMNPDVLIVDEALSVGDALFQQRSIRRIQRMKESGVTIAFVSHDLAAVRSLADRSLWMEQGRVKLEGGTGEVVSRYLAHSTAQGHATVQEHLQVSRPSVESDGIDTGLRARIPAFLNVIPNVDHRYGNGKARVAGIGVFGSGGDPTGCAAQGDRVCIRISVEFLDACAEPNVGFILRNRLGEDVTGTNVAVEGQRLPAATSGKRISVDFILELPFLKAGFYHISPAVADGPLDRYETCDWIDNAIALEIVERATTYGSLRIPVRVRWDAVAPGPVSGTTLEREAPSRD